MMALSARILGKKKTMHGTIFWETLMICSMQNVTCKTSAMPQFQTTSEVNWRDLMHFRNRMEKGRLDTNCHTWQSNIIMASKVGCLDFLLVLFGFRLPPQWLKQWGVELSRLGHQPSKTRTLKTKGRCSRRPGNVGLTNHHPGHVPAWLFAVLLYLILSFESFVFFVSFFVALFLFVLFFPMIVFTFYYVCYSPGFLLVAQIPHDFFSLI